MRSDYLFMFADSNVGLIANSGPKIAKNEKNENRKIDKNIKLRPEFAINPAFESAKMKR